MALVGPRVLNYLGESKVKAAKIQIESFSSALDLYYLDLGRYPASSEGLAALVQRPAMRRAGTVRICGAAWSRTIPGDTATSIVRRASMRLTTSSRSGRTVRRAALERQPTSRSGMRVSAQPSRRGFTLIEIVCVLAIIGLLAAIILPAIPRGTTRARLEELCGGNRCAAQSGPQSRRCAGAIRVATQVDAEARSIRSGATGRVVRLPDDVSVDAMLAARCDDRPAGTVDRFLSVGNVVRRRDRADASGDRLSGSRQLADRRRRDCPAKAALTGHRRLYPDRSAGGARDLSPWCCRRSRVVIATTVKARARSTERLRPDRCGRDAARRAAVARVS